MKSYLLGAGCAAAVFSASIAGAAPFQNGGFESPDLSGTTLFQNFTVAEQGIPNWTVTTNSVDIVQTPPGPSGPVNTTGSQYLDLVGEGTSGGISQTFDTIIGTTYKLAFFYSHNTSGGADPRSATVAVVGGSNQDLLPLTSILHSASGWAFFEATFLANAVSATLIFNDTTPNANFAGIFLDDITIDQTFAQAPLPAALPLFATILAGGGLIAWRRKRKAAKLAAY